MHRASKIILTIAGVAVLIAISLTVMERKLAAALQDGIGEIGSRATGTPWTVEAAEISLSKGRGALRKLTIGNPAQYDSEFAVHLEKSEFLFCVDSLLGEELIIEEIVIYGPQLIYEQAGLARSNLQSILGHVQEFRESRVPLSTRDNGDAPQRFLIRKLELINVRVSMRSALFEPTIEELPGISLTELSGDLSPDSIGKIALQLMDPIVSSTLLAVNREVMDAGVKGVREELDKALEERFKRDQPE